MKTKLIVFGLLFAVLCSYSLSYSGVPQMINYQGKLTTPAGALIDDTLSMVFAIYDSATDGGVLWTETQPSVVVEKGIFSVLLGSANSIPDSVFTGATRYLGVKVGAGPEMSSRKAMVSVGYAFRSATADGGGGWVDDGTVVRLETQTDSVGIGTTTPSYRLHLEGSSTAPNPLVYVDQTGTGRGIWINTVGGACAMVTEAGNHGLRVISAGGDGIHVMQADGWAGYFEGTGYFSDTVGIGTSSPSEKLDVSGTVKMTGFKMPTGAGSGKILTSDASGVGTWQPAPGGIGGSGTANYIPKFLGSTTVGNSAIYETGGNVGIGTTSPSHKLEVAGNAGFDEYIYHNGDPDTDIRFLYDRIHMVAGGINFVDMEERSDQDEVTFNESSHDIDFRIESDNDEQAFFVQGSSGRVGIGTSPSDKLDVNGDIRVRGADIKDGGGTPRITLTAAGRLELREDGGSASLSIDTDGNVGIGTASPGSKIHITNESLTRAQIDGSMWGALVLGDYNDGTDEKYFHIRSDGAKLYLGKVNDAFSSWSNKFVMDRDGNVGIGTSSPGYTLHVNGDFYASTVNTGLGNYELYAMNQNVRTTDNPTFNRVHLSDYGTALGGFHVGGTSDPGTDNLIVDGNVEAGAFDYSSAQTRYYSIAPSDFIPGTPDVSDVYYFRDDITVQGGSASFLAPVHLPHGAVIKEVCVWFENSSQVWDFHRVDHSSGVTDLIYHASPGCQSLTHTVDNINYSYQVRTYTHGAGDEVYGGRVKYEAVNPLP